MPRFPLSVSLAAGVMLAGLAVACGSGASESATPRHYGRVAFSCPGGWKTDAADHTDSVAVTVSCEREGFGSSGVVSLSWFSDTLDQGELQRIFRQQLQKNPIYKTADIRFQPLRPGRYGRYPAQVGAFDFKLLSVAHAGAIYSFNTGGQSVVVLEQQALEDTATNRPGLRVLAQSLECRGK